VGADGPTHHGAFDLSYLRCIPNLTVMTPSDENECRQMLYTAFQLSTPAAVRYPRGTGPGTVPEQAMKALPLGRGRVLRQGKRVALLAFGSMVKPALEAAESVDGTVVDMRFVKPLDEALVSELAGTHDYLVTLEENVIKGGAGSAVLEYLASAKINKPVLQIGLPDHFVEHGDPGVLLMHCGLNGEGVARRLREWLP
jgi:1-deoxy-D-xylulose-5-phosphate synthase